MSYLTFLAAFPHEAVPDGAVFAPHHLYIGVLAALLGLAMMWDDRTADPWACAASILAALFGFALVWPHYATAGAALSVGGLTAALLAPAARRGYWSEVNGTHFVAYLSGVLIALDDVAEHAFGVWTPLDHVWSAWLFDVVTSLG